MSADTRLQIGLMCRPDTDPAEIKRIALHAEQGGADFFACGEHLFFHTPVSNAFVTLAAAAGAAERISSGRFELGVGVGGEYPPEFTAAGIPVGERGRRADEALELLRRLFAGQPVNFEGQFAEVDGLHLDSPPPQQPGPSMWVGGRQESAMRRAARFADFWLPYLVTPRRMAKRLERVRELAAQERRAPQAPRGALFCWGCVDADGGWARRAASESMAATYQQDFGELAQALLPSGDVAAVTDRLGEYLQPGAEALLFAPSYPGEHRECVVDTFLSEVVPTLRKGFDG